MGSAAKNPPLRLAKAVLVGLLAALPSCGDAIPTSILVRIEGNVPSARTIRLQVFKTPGGLLVSANLPSVTVDPSKPILPGTAIVHLRNDVGNVRLGAEVFDGSTSRVAWGAVSMVAVTPGRQTSVLLRLNTMPIDDPDMDGIPTPIDNCPTVSNPDQADTNKNRIGDKCEPDGGSGGSGGSGGAGGSGGGTTVPLDGGGERSDAGAADRTDATPPDGPASDSPPAPDGPSLDQPVDQPSPTDMAPSDAPGPMDMAPSDPPAGTDTPVDPPAAPDTPVDPPAGMEAGMDMAVDPRLDTPIDPTVDPPVDPPVDAPVDPGMEPIISCTNPVSTGSCGGDTTMKCGIQCPSGTTICVPEGTGTSGQTCTEDPDSCVAGYGCVCSGTSGPCNCRRFCPSPGGGTGAAVGCPTGVACNTMSCVSGGPTLPYGFCQ